MCYTCWYTCFLVTKCCIIISKPLFNLIRNIHKADLKSCSCYYIINSLNEYYQVRAKGIHLYLLTNFKNVNNERHMCTIVSISD